MPVNVWAVVGVTPGYLPMTALIGSPGQLLGMDAAGTAAEWKNWTILSDQLTAPVGAVGAPSYTFAGDLTTGWYRAAADSWSFAVGGVDKLILSTTHLQTSQIIQLVGRLLWEDQSANIAAAATTDINNATGNYIVITNAAGTINLSSLGADNIPAGTSIETKFSITGGSVTLVHNATSLVLLGGANILLADGDLVRWRKINDSSPYWEMVGFQRGVSTSGLSSKGALLVGEQTGAVVVTGTLTAGADGEALVADSSQNKGLRWSPSVAARKNAIINGAFDVWQRGTSFASLLSGSFFADRWYAQYGGTMDAIFLQQTDVPTVASAGVLFGYSASLTVTTPDASIGASDYGFIAQNIEGYNWRPLAQVPTVLTFYIKCNLPGIYCVSIGSEDRRFIREFTVNSSGVWEKKVVKFDASPTAGTWNFTTGIGCHVRFMFAGGSSLYDTPDTWVTTSSYASSCTANQANLYETIGNYAIITGVQLEAGSVNTKFEQRTFAEELALCQRYYELGGLWYQTEWVTAASIGSYQQYAVAKRASPTVAFNSTSYYTASGLVYYPPGTLDPTAGFGYYFLPTGSGGYVITLWSATSEL